MNADEKINILLVDDRSENLLALEAIIENDDYHLIKAYSGEEALKYLIKIRFCSHSFRCSNAGAGWIWNG